jgi:uncharacterized protein with PIN domain
MPVTKPELKALLTREAERIIERLVEECDPAGKITLNDIEEGVLGAGRELQASLTKALVEATLAQEKDGVGVCPVCGGKMRHHEYRKGRVVTKTGEVMVRRAYHRCERCGKGIFPPG